MTDWLRKNLTEALQLPGHAVDWLCDLYHVIQFFDDVADNDPITRSDFNGALWLSLVAMPENAFYIAHRQHLAPVIGNAILKWQASDTAERLSCADQRSFMWRASYYDVVLSVMLICHGPEIAASSAHLVMALYGESYTKYSQEFEPCQIQ